MANEKKIREIYGVKSVLDEAAERIEATWREKLLHETGDLRTENALLRAQLDEFNRKLVEARDRNERLEADCNERVAFIEEKFELDTASLELENNELHEYLATTPRSVEDHYTHVVAEQMEREQLVIMTRLNRHGILGLRTTPERLSVDVINKYLEIKHNNW